MIGPTIEHPTAVVVQRANPLRDRHFTPQISERLDVQVGVQTAPTPVQDTTFAGVGRDAEHATPHIWRYQALAIADKLSIMAPNFLVPKVLSQVIVNMPRGMFIPMVERTNIDRPDQTTNGARTDVQSPLVIAPEYLKLI